MEDEDSPGEPGEHHRHAAMALSGSVGPRTTSCSPPPEGAALPISTPQVGAEAQAGPGGAAVTSQTSGGARPVPLVFETLSKLLR